LNSEENITLIDANTRSIKVVTPNLSSLPLEDQVIRSAVRDTYGRLWIVTGYCESRVFQLNNSTGALIGPFLTIVSQEPSFSDFEIEYNNNNLYVPLSGQVYLGSATTSTVASQGLLVFSAPETLPATPAPSSLVTTTVPIFNPRKFDFDSNGLIYTFNPDGQVARWDGATWANLTLNLGLTGIGKTTYLEATRIKS